MQELPQFLGEVATGRSLDQGFHGGDQSAPAREPDRLKGPQALGIELRDLRQGVVAAAVGVAGAIGEFLQLTEHRGVDGGSQHLLQLGQGGDLLPAQELAHMIGEESGGSHNAIVPPMGELPKRNYSRMARLSPADPKQHDTRIFRSTSANLMLQPEMGMPRRSGAMALRVAYLLLRRYLEQGGGRGASTITQQLVKNLFFGTGRSLLRKGAEFMLVPVAEFGLGKRRILELYPNVVEWGPGIYGIEAASGHYYATVARSLGHQQASRLAAILPAPLKR